MAEAPVRNPYMTEDQWRTVQDAWKNYQLHMGGVNAGNAGTAAGKASGQQWANNPNNPYADIWGSSGFPDLTKQTNVERQYPQTEGAFNPDKQTAAFGDPSVQGFLTSPSSTKTVADTLVGQMMDWNPEIPNNAQGEYDYFGSHRPDFGAEPDLGAYYENAKRRADESIRNIMSAKGAYGSSAANAMSQEAITNLEAQRAKEEADYGLRRLAEERAWAGTGGTLAQGADVSGTNAIRTKEDLFQAIVDVSRTGDQAETDRIIEFLKAAYNMDDAEAMDVIRSMTAAAAADQSALIRGQTGFGMTSDMGFQISDILGQDYKEGLTNDQELLLSQLEDQLGPLYAIIASNSSNSAQAQDTFQKAVDAIVELAQGGEGS